MTPYKDKNNSQETLVVEKKVYNPSGLTVVRGGSTALTVPKLQNSYHFSASLQHLFKTAALAAVTVGP